jgi:O-antigen/teichoic acid export membrane protein
LTKRERIQAETFYQKRPTRCFVFHLISSHLAAGDKTAGMNEVASRIAIQPQWPGVKSRLASHFTTTLVAQVAILGLGALSGVVVARLLGPEGRGEFAALTLWPSMLVSLAAMGINQAIVFNTGRRLSTLSEVWTSSTIIGLGQSILVVVVGLPLISLALRHYSSGVRDLAFLFLAASPLVILGGYPGNLLQGILDLSSFNLIRTTAPLVYAGGIAVLFFLHRPLLREVVGFQILGYGLALGIGYWFLFKKVPIRFAWNGGACLSLVSYGWKTQLGNVSSYVNRSADQLVLSLFVAPSELGLYAVAVTMATAVGLFPQAAGIVTLAAGSSSNSNETRKIIGHSFLASLFWLIIVCSLLFILAPALIKFIFGSAFARSATACRILLPGAAALGLNQVLYDGARSLGEPALPSYAEGFATVVTFLGLWAFLPKFGFIGAAIASTLAYVSSLGLMLFLCRTRLRIGLRDIVWTSAGPTADQNI